MKGCFPSVPFIYPVVWRPGEEVRDEEGDMRVGAHSVERRIALDAMELDDLVGLDEGQDADLRVTSWSARDQRAVAHLRHEPVRGCFVGWVVGAGEHPTSLGEPPPEPPSVPGG